MSNGIGQSCDSFFEEHGIAEEVNELAEKKLQKLQEAELKPCPFCGNIPDYETLYDGEERWHTIECKFCCVTMNRSEKEELITAWNSRRNM